MGPWSFRNLAAGTLVGLAAVLGYQGRVAAQPHPSPGCVRPEVEQSFRRQLWGINSRIKAKQRQLERMFADPTTSEEQIKIAAEELLSWKTRRDQLAIEYILRQRRDECPVPSFSNMPQKP